MSIIQEALRRKAEDPNTPSPPFPPMPPPPAAPERPVRKSSRRKGCLYTILALFLFSLAVIGVAGYVARRMGRSFLQTLTISIENAESDFQPIDVPGPEDQAKDPRVTDSPPVPEPATHVPAPSVPVKEPAAAPAPSPEPWPRLALSGVLAAEAGRGGAALIQGAGPVGEGETIRGVRVVRIQADTVTLEYRGEQRVLRPGQSTDDER